MSFTTIESDLGDSVRNIELSSHYVTRCRLAVIIGGGQRSIPRYEERETNASRY